MLKPQKKIMPGAGVRHYLLEAWKRRRAYIGGNKLEAFRLATREDLGIPVAVDVYGAKVTGAGRQERLEGGAAVLQLYEERLPAGMIEGLRSVLSADYGLSGFYEKKRFRKLAALSGGAPVSSEMAGNADEKPVEVVVNEYGHKFIVNLNNHLDCGLFLDHRETRRRVERMVRDSITGPAARAPMFLNLFSYSGSFSVYAAAGGAAMTHSVDLSKSYCEWARRNLSLNGFPEDKHWIYRMDVFEFYKYAARKKLQFDLIVIDPPTFSRNKDSSFSVQKDQMKLLTGAANLLLPNGQIIFSNNCLDFRLDRDLNELFSIKDIQNETIPLDFWVDTINPQWWTEVNQIHNCFLLTKK